MSKDKCGKKKRKEYTLNIMSVIKITRGPLCISLTWVLTPTNLMLEERKENVSNTY